MSRAETDTLLTAELALGAVQTAEIRAAWAADPAWQRLLDFLDGHPRSVWLVSRHFDGPRASLSKVVERLENARADAVVDPALIGRKDAHAILSDADAQRMRSLVADDEAGPEAGGLEARSLGEPHTRDPTREAEVVADHRAGARLTGAKHRHMTEAAPSRVMRTAKWLAEWPAIRPAVR